MLGAEMRRACRPGARARISARSISEGLAGGGRRAGGGHGMAVWRGWRGWREWLVVAAVVLACALALALALALARRGGAPGGAALAAAVLAPPGARGGGRPPGGVLIVDTLNLTHGRVGPAISPDDIIETVRLTAPELRAQYDRVIYVLKSRETQAAQLDEAAARRLQEAARQYKVLLYVAVEYADPPARRSGTPTPGERVAHARRARDDFLMAVLAQKFRAPVMTRDRMQDFGSWRANLAPFRVYVFDWWSPGPAQEYYAPDAPAYAALRAPRRVRAAPALLAPPASCAPPPPARPPHSSPSSSSSSMSSATARE